MYYIYTLYKVTSQNVIEFHVFHVRFYRSDQIRSEEHTSELQSHVRISYAVFCLKKKKKKHKI